MDGYTGTALIVDLTARKATEQALPPALLRAYLGGAGLAVRLLYDHLEPGADALAPGNVIVEMHWPSDMNIDMDLWVKGPNTTPVGFWNQGNDVFNLLRDDLGTEGDATNENYEISYSRGIRPGEYVVNAHMYSIVPNGLEVPVKIVVSVRAKYDTTRQLLETTLKLTRRNQEETAFRFRLTAEGELVEGSVSTLRYPLITGYRKRSK